MSKELIRTFTDEEGQSFTFEDIEAAQRELARLESFIGTAMAQMAFGLKEIRDKRLYLLRGADSFRDYCADTLSISRAQAYNYLAIASVYEKQSVEKLQGMSVNKLLTLSKDEAFVEGLNSGETDVDGDKVVYADGSTESLLGVIERAKRQTQKELENKLQGKNDLLQRKDVLIKEYKEREKESSEKVKELEESLDKVARMKDVDPRLYVRITKQTEAADLIDEIIADTSVAFGRIGRIPPELIDAQLAVKFSTMMSSIEAGLHNIREQYGDQVLFAQAPRADDFIPE